MSLSSPQRPHLHSSTSSLLWPTLRPCATQNPPLFCLESSTIFTQRRIRAQSCSDRWPFRDDRGQLNAAPAQIYANCWITRNTWELQPFHTQSSCDITSRIKSIAVCGTQLHNTTLNSLVWSGWPTCLYFYVSKKQFVSTCRFRFPPTTLQH